MKYVVTTEVKTMYTYEVDAINKSEAVSIVMNEWAQPAPVSMSELSESCLSVKEKE